MLYPEYDWQCASCYESPSDWSYGELKEYMENTEVDADSIVEDLEQQEVLEILRNTRGCGKFDLAFIGHRTEGDDESRGRFEDVLTESGWFNDPSPTFVAGPHGSGRTNTAFALGDEWRDNGGSVASNVRSCDEAALAESASEVVEWARKTPGKKLFIYDEATTLLSYQRRMRPVFGALVSRLRDEGVKVVFVVDEVPEWANVWGATCVDKTDVATAKVYDERVPVEVSIPPTTFSYDSRGMAEWRFEGDTRGRDE